MINASWIEAIPFLILKKFLLAVVILFYLHVLTLIVMELARLLPPPTFADPNADCRAEKNTAVSAMVRSPREKKKLGFHLFLASIDHSGISVIYKPFTTTLIFFCTFKRQMKPLERFHYHLS